MTNKSSTEEFIQKAILIHGNKYNYTLVQYIKNKIKVKIICLIHGIFEQTPDAHLQGRGCQKCVNREKVTTDGFIQKAILVHGNKYDYSLSIYINSQTKIKIRCIKHNHIFEQTPHSHLAGGGCPKCANGYSKYEDMIEYHLKNYNINFIREHRFIDCVGIKNKLPFDFYLPDHNICIEFDGMHHYEPLYGINKLNIIKKLDSIKTKYCLDNNIKLIRIPYWEYKTIESIISNLFVNT
jgi:very-short-patch-repair endonuclease